MAKFCGSCGAQLNDEDRVCGQCGCPVADGYYAQDVSFVSPEMRERVARQKNLVISVIVIIVVIALGFWGISNFTGKKGLVRKVFKAYDREDAGSLVSSASEFYDILEMDEDEIEERFEDCIDYTISSFEDSVGHSYKLSYEIDEIYELSERKLNKFFDTIDDYLEDYDDLDIDIDFLKNIFVAEVELTAEQGKRTSDKKINMIMTKEDRELRLLYFGPAEVDSVLDYFM